MGKREKLDRFFIQLAETLNNKHIEHLEDGKPVLFLGDYITKFKDMLTMLTMEGCKPTDTLMVRKESAANSDDEMLEEPEAETYRSIVGVLMYFKRHRFDLHHVAKSLAMASSSPTKGHMRRLKRVLRYIQGTRDMHLELIRPREQLTEMIGWCDGSWADLDEKRRSTTGGLLMLGGACVAGWSRTQKPTAMSSGESEFYSATVCACELLWACEFLKGVGLHHDCSFERGRICMHWHGNTLRSWTTKTRRDQALCTPTLGTTGSINSRHGDEDRAVGRHHDKTYSKQTLATLAPKIGLVNRITDSTTSEASHDWIRTAVIAALTQGVSENTRNRSK